MAAGIKSGVVRAIAIAGFSLFPSLNMSAAKKEKAPGDSAPPTVAKLLGAIKAPAEFKVTIFGSPPDVNYPTCIAASPSGEVYVGVDQTGSLGHQPDAGWVLKCVDTKGTGTADKITKFAKMDHPRGLVWDHNKLFVLHPPFLSVYYDDNNTGVANRSEVLLTGISTEESVAKRGADHTTNGITLGIDGWIYIAVGDFGFFKCVGKDGKAVQHQGGGVARVRPDGTELEMVSINQRNIYGVGVDPLLNIFTRDNTNDGDGWDVRLHYIVPLCNVGYPTLYMNFQEDLLPRLADYGGGSPCGTTFLDEPGFPKNYGSGLYTCDWGRSQVYRHPLTADGANFKVEQQEFISIPRPTQMVSDALGQLYITSWKDGQFKYDGPNIGFVAKVAPAVKNVSPAGNGMLIPTSEQISQLTRIEPAKLVHWLNSASHVFRLAVQHEIIRRGKSPAVVDGLSKLAMDDRTALSVRVAAIFTLKQLPDLDATPVLLKLVENPVTREYALRAMADRKSQAKGVPTEPYVKALNDNDPRVRLHALNGLARLNRTEAAPSMLALTSDKDAVVAHIAQRALIVMNARDACIAALDHPESPTFLGALNVLKWFHDPKVVDAVISHLSTEKEAASRKALISVLCRLHFTEDKWVGGWWGTRPTNNGPYYKWVTWGESDKIKSVLNKELEANGGDAEMSKYLIAEFFRHHLESPELINKLAQLAEKDPSFMAKAVEMFKGQKKLSPDAIHLMEIVASSPTQDVALRGKALRTLAGQSGDESLDAVSRVFAAIGSEAAGELKNTRDSFIRDGKRASQIQFFAKLTASQDAKSREFGYSVIAVLANSNTAKPETKKAGVALIDKAWADPVATISLMRAIGQMRVDAYSGKIREHLEDKNIDAKQAAVYAAGLLKLTDVAAKPAGLMIAEMPVDQVAANVLKIKGDVTVGQQMFLRQGCVACHTVVKNDPPKGPYLGDIATRYPAPEIVESVLKPNAKIAQGFQTNWFKMKDNDRKEGFIVKEGGEEIEIRDVTGNSITIELKDVVKRGKSETSIMPEGIIGNMTMDEFASLLAYLQSLTGK